jgi:hypothetical protein
MTSDVLKNCIAKISLPGAAFTVEVGQSEKAVCPTVASAFQGRSHRLDPQVPKLWVGLLLSSVHSAAELIWDVCLTVNVLVYVKERIEIVTIGAKTFATFARGGYRSFQVIDLPGILGTSVSPT